MHLSQYETAIEACTRALSINAKYIKVLLRRSSAYEHLKNYNQALEDAKKVPIRVKVHGMTVLAVLLGFGNRTRARDGDESCEATQEEGDGGKRSSQGRNVG